MSATKYLSPMDAVKYVWARSAKYSSSPEVTNIANRAESYLTEIKSKVETLKITDDHAEYEYFFRALMSIEATDRTIGAAHKHFDNDIVGNTKLRQNTNDRIADSVKFGTELGDAFKSAPAIIFGSASGVGLLVSIFQVQLTAETTVLATAFFGGASYLVSVIWVRKTSYLKERELIRQDYEKCLYYDQYVRRSREALLGLYNDMNCIHEVVFNSKFPENRSPEAVVDEAMRGVSTTYCDNIHTHIDQKKTLFKRRVNADKWPVCETGGAVGETCKITLEKKEMSKP